MDLLDRIVDYLNGEGFECSKKRLDSFAGEEGTVVRLMDATVRERNFDRTCDVEQPFQVIVVRESEREAKETCQAIAECLDDILIASNDGSYIMVNTEVYTGPAEFALDERNMYAWHVRFISEIVT